VVILGGYADLRELLRFASTGAYAYGGEAGRREPHRYVREILGQSLVEWGPPVDRERLRALVEHAASEEVVVQSPQGPPPAALAALSPEGRRLAELLLNRDPDRFDNLYTALPAAVREQIERLNVTPCLEGLTVPVFILHPDADDLVPPTEALRLWEALPEAARGRLVRPSGLSHRLPHPEDLRGRPLAYGGALARSFRFLAEALYPTV
jgi:pimeloyl-ACP methyl ester carboxylesterase